MEAVERPETLPTHLDPPREFLFDFAQIEEAKTANERLVNHYEERIDRLVNHFRVANDMPVIGHILMITRDREELKELAKGLDRVADLVAVLDELKTRQQVMEYAEKDPTWFKAAFANLELEIDNVFNEHGEPELHDEDKDLLA